MLTRREFLRRSGLVAAASAVPAVTSAARAALAATPEELERARSLSTLARTIIRGGKVHEGTHGAYYRLQYGPGEPHVRRIELANRLAPAGDPFFSFVHACDNQLADVQSPARVEFLDRFNDQACSPMPFSAAFRPQEALGVQEIEQMNRTLRKVRVGPVTGDPLRFTMFTGDNLDNAQLNELRWFIDLMDGGATVAGNSGGPDFEGVQSADWLIPTGVPDPHYWHPDPVDDKFKSMWGFPDYPGLLQAAIQPFRATGLGMPWLQVLGNHDSLLQGNAPENPAFEAIATGPLKVVHPDPAIDPCNVLEAYLITPESAFSGPANPVTPDPQRATLNRRGYIAEFFRTSGRPVGHGFTPANLQSGRGYYHIDYRDSIRFISLDTVNPGGFAAGSIGAAQLAWLEQRLIEAHSTYLAEDGTQVSTGNRDRLVILFGHHASGELNNPVIIPNPFDLADNDLPRIFGDEVLALLHRFPNVIAWFSGHTHRNEIQPRPDPARRTNGFWEVTTASQCDWVIQTRTVEIVKNGDGTISIWCTMIDHDAPADPRGATGIPRLASIHRELSANDPHGGYDSGGYGARTDRNVELVVRAPAWFR